MKKKSCLGVLLVNLGTPNAPTPRAVRRFLREFLSDPRVVRLPRFLWWILLNTIIVPLRCYRSALAYQQIWTEKGSPLRVISEAQAKKLQATLADNNSQPVEVVLGMRYGNPSISDALMQLQKAQVTDLVVLPLYPQYSSTTTASVLDVITQQMKNWPSMPKLKIIHQYYDHHHYIEALCTSIRNHWQQGRSDHLLFSFHGVPRDTVDEGDPYDDHCRQTARQVAKKLQLKEHEWSLAYQSRFGRARWLTPYCDEKLVELANQGIQTIDIICPGFSADCLETLEEISIRYKKIYLSVGGRELRYIPALNTSDEHINLLSSLILQS